MRPHCFDGFHPRSSQLLPDNNGCGKSETKFRLHEQGPDTMHQILIGSIFLAMVLAPAAIAGRGSAKN